MRRRGWIVLIVCAEATAARISRAAANIRADCASIVLCAGRTCAHLPRDLNLHGESFLEVDEVQLYGETRKKRWSRKEDNLTGEQREGKR